MCGNYADYFVKYNEYAELFENYDDEYVTSYLRSIYLALENGEKINRFSSQEKMNEALSLLEEVYNTAEKKGDYASLVTYINQIFDEMASTNRYDYETRSYLLFEDALQLAYSVNENSSDVVINNALTTLKEAYENLERGVK